jgi:hypothetical protein
LQIALTNLQEHGLSANRGGVILCLVFHGIFFVLYNVTIGAKGLCHHTVIFCMLSGISTIGDRQSAALHKQFAAIYQFLPTLPIIKTRVVEKHFFKIQNHVSLK